MDSNGQVVTALRESESKLNRILQTIVDGLIIVDQSGIIVYTNASAEHILDLKQTDMLGKYYGDLELHQTDAQGQPYPSERFPLTIALREQHEVDVIEHAITGADGQVRWLSINAAPLFDDDGKLNGAVASFRDITEQKKVEEARNWLASFPERNPSPVTEVDLSGNVCYLNPIARTLFPDMEQRGQQHPWLKGISSVIDAYIEDNAAPITRDVTIDSSTYQQMLFYIPEKQRIRIYSLNITKRKAAEEALRQVRDELEIRVQERTQELKAAYELLQAEISQRQQFAQNLHDAVNQSLFSAGLIAEVLPRLWERDQAAARQSLEDLRRLTRGAQAELRALLVELRPSVLSDADLGELLQLLGNMFTGRMNIPVTVKITGEGSLPSEVQVVFYHLCEESLNNIAKHAGASQVDINLKYKTGKVELCIRDNGRGFDPSQPAPAGHYGLNMMRERSESVDADLTITSQAGHGTEILVSWKNAPKKEAPKT